MSIPAGSGALSPAASTTSLWGVKRTVNARHLEDRNPAIRLMQVHRQTAGTSALDHGIGVEFGDLPAAKPEAAAVLLDKGHRLVDHVSRLRGRGGHIVGQPCEARSGRSGCHEHRRPGERVYAPRRSPALGCPRRPAVRAPRTWTMLVRRRRVAHAREPNPPAPRRSWRRVSISRLL